MANFITNNVIFERIKQDDCKDIKSVGVLKASIDGNMSQEKDKLLHRYVQGIYKGEHITNSYAIFCKLTRDKFNPDLLNEKRILKWEKKILKPLRDGQNKFNQRIDFLLRGDDL